MNSFLQSPAWESSQVAAGARTGRHQEQLYLERSFSFGHYWLSSRCQLSPNFSLPPFAKGAAFLRLEPQDLTSLDNLASFAKKRDLKLRPTFAVQPRQSILVDISGSYDKVLQNMKSKARYNTRLAERSSALRVQIGREWEPELFERFWLLLEETARRQHFRTHPKDYYQQLLQSLSKPGMARLILVSSEKADLAGLILLLYQQTAVYLHGASSQKERALMAPYLLHASAIREAKEAGCQTYDLWGSNLLFNQDKNEWELPEGQTGSGTSRFKLGFGGQVVTYPGTYDLVLRPFCYTLYQLVRRLRGGQRAFS